jgi:hypothetical protein
MCGAYQGRWFGQGWLPKFFDWGLIWPGGCKESCQPLQSAIEKQPNYPHGLGFGEFIDGINLFLAQFKESDRSVTDTDRKEKFDDLALDRTAAKLKFSECLCRHRRPRGNFSPGGYWSNYKSGIP